MAEHSVEEIKRQIEECEANVGRLWTELRQERDRLRALRVGLCPVKAGDLVVLTGHTRKGELAKVARIHSFECSTSPWVMVFWKKKDGSFGDAEHQAHSRWRLATAEEIAS